MPHGADPPRYEAFLIQPDEDSHWVVAITSDPARTQARRLARLADATGAARLADALNSRILGRLNHHARLRAALDGLPLTVRAAVRHIPAGEPGADVLADHLPGDPIDGLLLFPTTPPVTPRTAYAVAFAAEDVGDLCHEAAQAADVRTARRFLPRLPAPLRRQRPEQLLSTAADLDQLAATLGDGLLPETRTAADRLSTRTALEHAERLHRDDPELFADGTRLLPASPHDYDFDTLRRHLLDAPARISLRTT